jgi:hypothetical protein
MFLRGFFYGILIRQISAAHADNRAMAATSCAIIVATSNQIADFAD